MQTPVEQLVAEFYECEQQAADAFLQLSDLRQRLSEAFGMSEIKEDMIAQVPFIAYDAMLEREREEKHEMIERHMKEKNEMRKHYRKLVMWIAIPFVTFMFLVFGAMFYIFANYEFQSYEQDVSYGNANFIGNDGDITNGEPNYNYWTP